MFCPLLSSLSYSYRGSDLNLECILEVVHFAEEVFFFFSTLIGALIYFDIKRRTSRSLSHIEFDAQCLFVSLLVICYFECVIVCACLIGYSRLSVSTTTFSVS